MAINLSDNIQTNAPKSADSRYMNNLVPYVSVAEVNSTLDAGVRFSGLTVNILGVEYWYKEGIGDGDLLEKTSAGGGTLNMSGSTVGGLTTYVDANTVCAHSGLTYTGTTLSVKSQSASSDSIVVVNSEDTDNLLRVRENAGRNAQFDLYDRDGVSQVQFVASGTSHIRGSGGLNIYGAGCALALREDGTNHVYMEFYADSGATTTRSAYFGFPSNGVSGITLCNQMTDGCICISPNGTGTVELGYGGANKLTTVSYGAFTTGTHCATSLLRAPTVCGTGGISTGGNFITTTSGRGMLANTTDGSDTNYILLAGGGAASSSRGGVILISGNENVTYSGDTIINPGGNAGAFVKIDATLCVGDGIVCAGTCLKTPILQQTTGAADGCVLTSNAAGCGVWATPAAAGIAMCGNTVEGITTYVDANTICAHQYLQWNGSTLNISGATTETRAIQIGVGRTDSGYAYVDLVGDTTYTDYGLRIIRMNTGANARSVICHRGTGDLEIGTVDGGAVNLLHGGSSKLVTSSIGVNVTGGVVITSTGAIYSGVPSLCISDTTARSTVLMESQTDNPTDFFTKINGKLTWSQSVRQTSGNHSMYFYPSTNGTSWGGQVLELHTGGTVCATTCFKSPVVCASTCVSVGTTAMVSCDTFIRFAGDRPWEFIQDGDDGNAHLTLMPDTDQKIFAVKDCGYNKVAAFCVYNGNGSHALLYHDGNEKLKTTSTGIEVADSVNISDGANSVTMEYNTTSCTLDFIFA